MMITKMKENLRLFKIVIFVLLITLQIGSAAVLELDVCRFKGDNDMVFLELYVEFQRIAIEHKVENGKLYGAIGFQVDILEDNVLLTTDKWRIEDNADKPADIDSLQKIVDVRSYKLPPGNYDLRVTATDSISQCKFKDSKNIKVDSIPDDALSISDIELSSYVIPSGLIEKYDRGNFGLIPNPSLLFGKELQSLYYYFEIYPPSDNPVNAKYKISYAIILSNGNIIKPLPDAIHTHDPTPFADVDSISLANLGSGSYTLRVQVSTSEGDTVKQSKRFFVFRPKTELASDQNATYFFISPQDSSSIEQELREIKFLLTKGQLGRTERMSINDKALFLKEFWQRIDTGNAADIPLRQRFRQRVAEADERYGSSRTPGHQTPMGRIYALCGEPDDREAHSLELNALPYEIWNYFNIQGGVIFVFVDRNGFGDYTMVHSTLRGELYNTNWYRDYVEQASTNTYDK